MKKKFKNQSTWLETPIGKDSYTPWTKHDAWHKGNSYKYSLK